MSNSNQRHILIIQGHPDDNGGHFCHAIADQYAKAAEDAGHAVRIIDIAQLDFPILRSQTDFQHSAPPAALHAAQDAIRWADHLVIIFPLWLGTMPALLKAFWEQALRPGYAFAYNHNNFPQRLLRGRSARLFITMGTPGWVYRWFFLAHAIRGFKRNILHFVGIKPVREHFFGLVEDASEKTRAVWLKTVARHGRKGD